MDRTFQGQSLFRKQTDNVMILYSCIAGDIIGSRFEWNNIKQTRFELFAQESRYTDDTVLTIATMQALLNNGSFAENYHKLGNKYIDAGYGRNFLYWLKKRDKSPYNSWGNGSAMRVSPIGWDSRSIEETIEMAKKSAEVTHDHPDGIKGAQAVAASVFLAKKGYSKEQIKSFVENTFSYNLNRTINEIRPNYTFDVSCNGSVPEAIIAFLESANIEDAIRKAVSIGGDSDTIACISGAIAGAFYKDIPNPIVEEVTRRIPQEFIETIEKFEKTIVYG